MASAYISSVELPHRRLAATLRDYCILTKPEVNLLILMSTSAGYYLGGRGPFRVAGLAHTLIGTLLVASGTATLNQWMERSHDAGMRRTAARPLPAGRLAPRAAASFGFLLGAGGVAYLGGFVNWEAALLALLTLLSYLLIYTPLKRKTSLCTLLGAFPGATPTLIGWAASAGRIDGRAWALFTILFLWQFPHFLSIALMYREDYRRAGYRMLPAFDRDTSFTRTEIVMFSVVLIIVTIFSAGGGTEHVIAMAIAGSFLLYHSLPLLGSDSTKHSAHLVHVSVIYLPVVLGIMIAGKG
jgi:protoheme IX farnesyltransferase